MKNGSALIFGYNEYGIEIANNVTHRYESITIFSPSEMTESEIDNTEFKIEKFDLSDNWDDLKNNHDLEKSKVFCALSDEAENIFLTISLRAAFENLIIIALASNNEDANKLKMAGASKVIPVVETTANVITDMLKKPIVSEVLHSILYEDNSLKIEQIEIKNQNFFDGKFPADINWSKDHGVLVLSVIHEDMSSEFIYSSKSKHNYIKNGDILVAVGYENDLSSFKVLLGCDE